MAALSQIVDVTITLQSARITRAGFGTPLILDYHTKFAERVRFYSGLDEMIDDGFATTDAAYLAASAVFSQDPSVAQTAIGRRATAPDMRAVIELVATTSSRVYSVDINGETASYTSDASATAAEITDGIKDAIDALAISGLTATDNSGSNVTLNMASAGTWYSVKCNDLGALKVYWKQGSSDTDAGVAAELTAINTENADWYGIDTTCPARSELVGIVTWAETNGKLAVLTAPDHGMLAASDTANVAYTIKTASRTRGAMWFHPDNSSFIGAAVMGRCFPLEPGKGVAALKTLSGVDSVTLTSTHITNLKSYNANWYTRYGSSYYLTANGKVGSGEFMDVIRDKDWLENTIQTDAVGVQVANDKIPYTDAGIETLAASVRSSLEKGVSKGVLAPGEYTVTVPKVADVDGADREARELNSIEFTARLAGAIQKPSSAGR